MLPTLLLLLPSVSALNNIFNPLPYPECNTCVDAAANSCPGDYRTASYATCLCAGAGAPLLNNCVSTCNAVDTQPMGAADKVAGNWYSYCIMFFPDLCAEAEYYVRKDWWAERCGEGAEKGAGFGLDGEGVVGGGETGGQGTAGGSGTTGGSGGSGGSGTAGGSGASGASATGGAGFGGLGTGSGTKTAGSASQVTSAAAVNIHPAGWGVMVGLGMLGLNL